MNSDTSIGAAIGSACQRTKAIGCSSGFEAGESPDFIELWTPSDRICDRLISDSCQPAPLVLILSRAGERTLGDLAVYRRPGQPGPGQDGPYPDSAVWFAHGLAASCWLFLTPSESRQVNSCRWTRGSSTSQAWSRAGGKKDGSNSDAPASAEIDAVSEGQILAKPAT